MAKQEQTAKKEDKKDVWFHIETWGKRIAIIGAACATIWGGYQFLKPNKPFDVEAIYGPFTIPPAIADGVANTSKSLKSQITMSITNVSGRPIEDVGVQLQGNGFALVDVAYEGRTYQNVFTGRVEIGKVTPESTVIVTIWTDKAISPEYPPMIDHKTGYQRIQLTSDYDPVLRTLAILFFLFLFLLCFLVWKLARVADHAARVSRDAVARLTHNKTIERNLRAVTHLLTIPPEGRAKYWLLVRPKKGKEPPVFLDHEGRENGSLLSARFFEDREKMLPYVAPGQWEVRELADFLSINQGD